MTEISEQTFERCGNLQTIVLPSTITTIKKSAFYGCKNLTDIKVGASVVIEERSFDKCDRLMIQAAASNKTVEQLIRIKQVPQDKNAKL